MNTIDDAEIHQIVERVLKQVTGSSQPVTASAPAPLPAVSPAGNAAQTQGRKVVAIGSDHGGFELKEILKTTLTELGYDARDVGAYNKGAVDYPDFAHEVAAW